MTIYLLQIEYYQYISSQNKASNKLLTLFFPVKRVVSSFFKRQTKKYASILSCCWYCLEYPIYLSFIAYSFMFMWSLNMVLLQLIFTTIFLKYYFNYNFTFDWGEKYHANIITNKNVFCFAYHNYFRCYSVSSFDIVALNVQYSLWGMRS